MLSVKVFTLFPDLFPGPLGISTIGRALKLGLWSLEIINPRDFVKNGRVDNRPYGGGAGMIIRPDVLDYTFQSCYKESKPDVFLYFSPRGKRLCQNYIKVLARPFSIGLLCGRFEGVDQRILEFWGIEEVSIGDFLLTGGEIPAMTLIDAVVRLIPGVIGSQDSLEEESFSQGLLEHHQYTRPREWKGLLVPRVLLEGHHERIKKWRLSQAEEITKKRRPDLWLKYKIISDESSK